MSVTPSVHEGDRITIVVRIDTSLVAGDTKYDKITGGIIVFDPPDSYTAAALVAFVFRPGQETRTMSYGVCDYRPCDEDTPRTIRIAVNSNWDHLSAREGGYRAGHPSEMTSQGLGEGHESSTAASSAAHTEA